MTKKLPLLLLLFTAFHGSIAASPTTDGTYGIVIEGYDWGPAVSKVMLSLNEPVKTVNWRNYEVLVQRSSDCDNIPASQQLGSRRVINGYVSNGAGNRLAEGNHVTLVLAVAPNLPIGSPMQYSQAKGCPGNAWVDYKMTIRDESSGLIWNREVNRIMPIIDRFDLSGKFSDGNGTTLTYAAYSPETNNEKPPLLIWLHGGGEGGTDPSIPLVANRAANYASDEIQAIMGGAFVLVPQTPTRWMDSGEGTTWGEIDDIYFKALQNLIEMYIAQNPSIDRDRIYVGGCSNGGYMTIKLLIEYPDFYAAAFPSALAFSNEYLTDAQIERIKEIPMWFIHSKDDTVTDPEQTVVPVYNRLKAAGASDVYFSYYDHVVDITGFFGGSGFHYNGHLSWIYGHANVARHDYDGSLVEIDGRAVTIMEWLAAQSR
ncbi:MAG: prolyl oligopeptidase family serine peptidase [Bacteroidota bacterium]